MLKGLCEQQGIPVAARKMRSDPESRQPMFEVFFTSNHSIDLGDTVDSGDARRVNVLRLTSRFVPHPAGDDEQREDVSLKQRISRGELGMEFFFIDKEFAVTLQLWNTNILQPPRVVRETAEALKSDKLAAFIERMENKYRVGTTAESATEAAVKTAIAGFLGVPLKAARAKMVDLGFIISAVRQQVLRQVALRGGAPMRSRLP
jgi:hypothetical protein